MCPLLESIKVEDRQIRNWDYHLDRMKRSAAELWDGLPPVDEIQLREKLLSLNNGLYKLRVVYSSSHFCFEFLPYKLPIIRSLKPVYSDTIEYKHKFYDRSSLKRLYKSRGSADDIIIVKNGLITDSYYCNLALLKENQWYTPLSPLLKGTKREELIDRSIIIPEDIPVHALDRYEKIMLFNAMIEPGEIVIDCPPKG